MTRFSASPSHPARVCRPASRRGWAIPVLCLGLTLAAAGVTIVRGVEPPVTPAPAPAPTPAPPTPVLESIQQATAAELVGTMRNALAATVKTGVVPPTDPAKPPPRKAQAFRAALAAAATAEDTLAATLADSSKAKTSERFQAMRRVGSSLAALQVTFRYRGAEDDETEDHFRTLTAAYGVFRRNYGRDLLAAKTEGEAALSDAQKSAFDTLKKRGLELSKQLASIQRGIKDNPAAAFEVEAMLNTLAEVDKSRRDRRRLLNTLTAAELLLGRWAGTKLYVGTVYAGDAPKLAPADAAIAAYESALQEGGEAVFGAAAGEPGAVFAKNAVYAEDLGFERLPEAEVASLLQSLRAAVPGSTPPPAAASTETADRAADRQINADDPDDDTSLDAGDDDDPDGAAAGRAND